MHLPRPGETFGPYRIERQLGSGGMGVVHLATDGRLDRAVALKVMWPHLATDPDFGQRFMREASTLARLDSAHIVSIHDHGVHEGALYIATQYVEGGDLGSLLAQRGSLPAASAAQICAQIADALADAHRAGVVHRDVKPANVLLRGEASDAHAYLCDFGIAQTEDSRGLTVTGVVAGTWSWLAPERTQGSPATPASDLYALGCVLWACLNGGTAPYTGPDIEVAAAHLSQPVPRLPGTDPLTRRLNEILATALAKHPKDRFRSAAALRDQLLAVARTADSPHPAGKPRRARLAVAGAAGVLLLSGAALAGWQLLSDDPEPGPGPGLSSRAGADRAPLVSGDVDGDGRGDLMFLRNRSKGGDLTVTMTSTANGFAKATSAKSPTGEEFLGDFDGDHAVDVLSTTRPGDAEARRDVRMTVKSAGEGAASSDELTFPRVGPQLWTMVGDYDGDGRDDLGFSTDRSPGIIELWVARATDDGFAQPESWARIRGLSTAINNAMLPGDFDGDGDDDLGVEASLGAKDIKTGLRLIRSDGKSFDQPGPLRATPQNDFSTAQLAPADVDGDGTDELTMLVDAQGKQEVLLHSLRGDRFDAGASWVVTPAGIVYGSFIDTVASDVNGDGRDDLVRLDRWNTEPWRIDVLISTGTNYEQPSRRTTFDCAKECNWAQASLIGPFVLQ